MLRIALAKTPSFIMTLALLASMAAGLLPVGQALAATPVFINEIHYDNTGTDAGEAIEIAGPAGTALTGWSLVLYNGSGGASYNTTALTVTIPDLGGGFGVVVVNYPSNGIQNGSPDGLALVDAGSAVVQFLSYEGTFTAVGGPANGLVSTDIGVSENGAGPLGNSLQLAGTGTNYEDFTWSAEAANTFGAFNTGQTFSGGSTGPTDPVINEFVLSHVGTDDHEYVEIAGTPNNDYSTLSVLQIEGDTTGAGVVDSVSTVGTTNADGYWLTGFQTNLFENGTVSLLLVEGFTGAVAQDLDTNNDGALDAAPWTRILDDVAVSDGGTGDRTYSGVVLVSGYDGLAFAPGGASRIPDGTDTNAISDWVRNDFDLAGIPGFAGTPVVGEAYNTPGAMNEVFVPPPEACGDPFTPIYTVQGSGLASPLDGTEVAVEGVVVGDFEGSAALSGFYLQDATGDGDPATSDGIFVFTGSAPTFNASLGERVRVRGTVAEFNGMTEISGVSLTLLCSTGNSVAAQSLSLPFPSADYPERYEGMLVTFPQALVISEYFNFDRFGEIVLTSQRQSSPTAAAEPGAPAIALALQNSLDRITLDDGRGSQNPDPALHPNGSVFDLSNRFRGGDTVQNVTGVIDFRFDLYRIQPTQGAIYSASNPRPEAPDAVGGGVKVASFNVLNYFIDIDTGAFICGPAGDQECRGADTQAELTRQRTKILAALSAINADVVGLIEIENDAGASVLDLVAGLNEILGAGTYDYINTGTIGTDAIKQAMIYKPATVTPLGAYALLDSTVDPRFIDTKNRPALAQTFQDNLTGGIFTAVVNHLKSKGSDCNDVGDPDLGDGAGNCNLTRKAAAEALVDWLATDPTGSGDPDFLIMGDLNSYDKEDPIDAIRAGSDDTPGTADDYTDLIYQFLGEDAYSYVFDGGTGYLDHALANQELLSEVSGTTIWHINADEPDLLDYDMSFKKDAQDLLYEPNAFRSSDHDPVIVGLAVCDEIAPTLEVSVTPDTLWTPNHKYVEVLATVTASDNFDPHPVVTLVSVTSNEPDDGEDDGDTVNDIVIVDDYTFQLRAERSGLGTGRVYTITYQVTDACGNTTVASATVTVPLSQGG